MMRTSCSGRILEEWHQLLAILETKQTVELDGASLSIPSLCAVSRFNSSVTIDRLPKDVTSRLAASVSMLLDQVGKGTSIYGVTTGFGGSANTRTRHTHSLQTALLQMQLSAVLPVAEKQLSPKPSLFPSNAPSIDEYAKLSMPESWVRAAILVRCNSLLRGHSAVRLEVIEGLLTLVKRDIIPLVPLRGSISASGDLCPLAYIAGVLEGNPDVKVWVGKRSSRHLIQADIALRNAKLSPFQFGPKEALGLLNGTAFSVAVASHAQHEADNLAIFVQILTAIGVEALMGSVSSFHAFIGNVRPHRGQIDMAANIRCFLRGSQLATNGRDADCREGDLHQDRYPLRTSAQWLGPFLEDMQLAREQLNIELNSTTDNPLVDVEQEVIRQGGNFQATAVTSATEKTRTALEKMGKMIFAQSTELLDVRLNNNLPPNLAVDEPSLSYSLKGVDINMAAYMSELAFLANPVSNHVQSAEMCNQAINSLALVSARYTHMAVDIVSLMTSAYLYTLCQALDIRAMNEQFMNRLHPEIDNLTISMFKNYLSRTELAGLQKEIIISMLQNLATTTTMDSFERFSAVARTAQSHVVDALHLSRLHTSGDESSFALVTAWTQQAAVIARSIFCYNREQYLGVPDASAYLGLASRRMYNYVRKELNVPMHRGLVDHPTTAKGADTKVEKKNTGTQISIIYKALREGRLVVPIMECLEEALVLRESEEVILAKL